MGRDTISVVVGIKSTSSFCSSTDHQDEGEALVDIANASSYFYWINSNGWLQGSSYCSWFGVSSDGYVTHLYLSQNNLSGNLHNWKI